MFFKLSLCCEHQEWLQTGREQKKGSFKNAYRPLVVEEGNCSRSDNHIEDGAKVNM